MVSRAEIYARRSVVWLNQNNASFPSIPDFYKMFVLQEENILYNKGAMFLQDDIFYKTIFLQDDIFYKTFFTRRFFYRN